MYVVVSGQVLSIQHDRESSRCGSAPRESSFWRRETSAERWWVSLGAPELARLETGGTDLSQVDVVATSPSISISFAYSSKRTSLTSVASGRWGGSASPTAWSGRGMEASGRLSSRFRVVCPFPSDCRPHSASISSAWMDKGRIGRSKGTDQVRWPYQRAQRSSACVLPTHHGRWREGEGQKG